jgi:hypothetical protein
MRTTSAPTFWEELASLQASLDSLLGTLEDLGRIAEVEGIDAAGPFVVGKGCSCISEAEHSAVVGFTRDRLAIVSEVVRTIIGTVNHIADAERRFRRESRSA